MPTINPLGNALSGSTGTGSFVGSTSPTFVTPVLGTPASGNMTNCTNWPYNATVTMQVFTSGSGTYTPTSGARYVWVRAWGGGGGGGAFTTTSTTTDSATGGGAGGYAELWEAATSRAYAVGGGGAGASGGGTGTNGTGTTFGTAGAQISVGGGTAGTDCGRTSTTAVKIGPAGGTSTTGTLKIVGGPGGNAIANGSTPKGAISGWGGANTLGFGGAPGIGQTTGNYNGGNGLVPGTGGGGAGSIGVNTPTGGTGATGLIIVMEFA